MTENPLPGRATIEALLARGRLSRVAVDTELAALHLEHARRHLEAAALLLRVDVTGSLQLAYDAARKSLAAVLAVQGLRATARGGHYAVEEAARAQLVPPLDHLVDGFGWMRGVRNDSEYPTLDRPAAGAPEAEQAIDLATRLHEAAAEIVGRIPPF